MKRRSAPLRAEAGISLIEVMIAALVLLVGMGALATLVTGAHRAADASSSRVTALNLGREVAEVARSVDYALLTPTTVASALQANPGLSGTGNPWTVTRRGVAYSVTARACTFDDPRDGLAAGSAVPAPANECLPRAGTESGAPVEANPDDFRRVDVTVAWSFRGRQNSITITDSIVNPSGGIGPRIVSMTQPATQITGGTSVTVPVTTTSSATALHWIVDSAATEGDATGGPTSWSATWPIGTVGATGATVDGTYSLNAQPFDSRGAPGDTRTAIVQLNRSLPIAPTGLVGGRNESRNNASVELEWTGNPERDIVGYRIYRNNARLVCSGADLILSLTCLDSTAPETGSINYKIAAVDRTDLANASSALREGPASATLTVTTADTAPAAPTNLQVSVVENLAHLTWTAPATGTVAFYRIYRDGRTLDDRIARTATADPNFDDVKWGSQDHTYYVSAVSPNYNESARSTGATLDVP